MKLYYSLLYSLLFSLLFGVIAISDCQYCEFPFPKSYVVYHLGEGETINVDGFLNESAWTNVGWTDPFQDIRGPTLPKPRFDTFAKMRWDDNYLYIGAYIQEPEIWANQTVHDSVIFYDNDFEVFTDPNWSNSYYKEFEMNALNTTWDLYLNRPYIDGGSPTNNWDFYGPILTGVQINGTINDPNVVDRYWTVEIAFLLDDLIYLQANVTAPPKSGDQWRINFSRVEYHVTVVNGQFEKVPNIPEDNWVWSSQEVINMHIPERWGFIQFSTDAINTTRFVPDPHWNLRSVLLQVYYAEKKFASVTGYFTPQIELLELPDFILEGKCAGIPSITPNTNPAMNNFQVQIEEIGSSVVGYINNYRLMWLEENDIKMTVTN